jgi:CO/xanthine dehydrogenase FAD-binding subunit
VISAWRWTRPTSLSAALADLAAGPSLTPIAGGTDVMVLINQGVLREGHLLDLSSLVELRGIAVTPTETVVSALTTYTELATHPTLAERHPLLVAAARVSGAWAIQNRGTLAGNIANASPAADSPPALLAYRARLQLASVRGTRWVDYATFHQDSKRTARAPDELITRIALTPPPGRATQFYRKVGARRAQAISKVCLAAVAGRGARGELSEPRIALGSVGPTVILAARTGAWLHGQEPAHVDRAAARALLESELAPIDDVRSTERYRRRVAGNLLEQFLDEAALASA